MRKLFLIVVAVLAISSCGGTYHLDKSGVLNNADMSSYKTFMIQPADAASLPQGLLMDDVNNIYASVAKQLAERGYTQVDTAPDVLVYLALSTKQVVETKDALPPAYGYRYFGPRSAYIHSYYSDAQIISDIREEGILMVDMVDAKKNVHVFCAEVSTVVVGDGSKIKDLEELNKLTSVLFSKYPVKPAVK